MSRQKHHDSIADSTAENGLGPSPEGSEPLPRAKRRRLNFACNHCRSRKTRCDEGKPSCQACIDARIPCITRDLRRPGRYVERREAGQLDSSGASSVPACNQHAATGASAVRKISPRPLPPSFRPSHVPRYHAAKQADSEPTQDSSATTDADQDQEDGSTGPKWAGALPLRFRFNSLSCFDMLTEWLDLAVYRLGYRRRFRVSRGKSAALTTALPLTTILHSTPTPEACQQLLERYLQDVNIIFPIIDPEQARLDVALLASDGPALYSQSRGVSSLLRVYLVIAAGAISLGPVSKWHVFLTDCLALARQCLGQVIGPGSIEAIQALFLLSLCLRYTDDISSATAIIDLCVSVARSASLHRSGASSPAGRSSLFGSKETRQRVWFAIYCYEKLLSFEVGRASSIVEDECEAPVTLCNHGPSHELSSMLFQLSMLLSDINKKCVQVRAKEDRPSGEIPESSIDDKVRAIGECTMMLIAWSETVPQSLRPTSDLLCNAENFGAAAFIAVQYHLAIITMTRNSLLISSTSLRETVAFVAEDPWWAVMRNGQSIVASSARRIVRLLIELEERGQTPVLPTYSASLHALFILAMHSIRKPNARAVMADYELMQDAAHFVLSEVKPGQSYDDASGLLYKVQVFVKQILSSSKTAAEVGHGHLSSGQHSVTHSAANSAATPSSENLQNSPFGVTSQHSGSPMDFESQGPLAGGSFRSNVEGGISEGLYVSQITGVTSGSTHQDDLELAWLPGLTDEIGCDWADFTKYMYQ